MLHRDVPGCSSRNRTCTQEINWENAKIVGREQRWTQRKYREGKESLREKNKGITPLNSYNQLEQWQYTVPNFPFEKRSEDGGTHNSVSKYHQERKPLV